MGGCVVIAVLLASAYLWLWLGFFLPTVAITRDEVRLRSWFATYSYRRDEVERFSAESYTGWFYVVGWPVAGGALEPGVLTVKTVDRKVVRVSGTLSWRRSAQALAADLNEWLGIERPRAGRDSR